MSAAEDILRAARLLHERADAAPDGRWEALQATSQDGTDRWVVDEVRLDLPGDYRGGVVAQHIAALDPDAAHALAEVLEFVSDFMSLPEHMHAAAVERVSRATETFARTYLREGER